MALLVEWSSIFLLAAFSIRLGLLGMTLSARAGAKPLPFYFRKLNKSVEEFNSSFEAVKYGGVYSPLS